MPKTGQARVFFALIFTVLVFVIGRNLYFRYLGSALISAMEQRDVAAVRTLLSRGADANSKKPADNGKGPGTPALSLILKGYASNKAADTKDTKAQEEIACLLINHGADIRDDPQSYYSDLGQSCSLGLPAVARCLLEHGANASSVDVNHNSVLDNAVSYGMYSESGNTGKPIYLHNGVAIYSLVTVDEKSRRVRVSRELVTLLRQHGARLTAIQAVRLEDAKALEETLRADANVNARSRDGYTALHEAAQIGNIALMRLLLARGADVNIPANYGRTALDMAVGYRGNIEVARLLLDRGAKLNMAGAGFHPLLESIESKHADIARLLLERGADPNLERNIDIYQANALSAAVTNLPSLVPELLAHEADINGGDGLALRTAISAHRLDMVNYLLKRGAKIYLATQRTVLKSQGTTINVKPQPTLVTTPSMLQLAAAAGPVYFETLMRAGADFTPDKPTILLAAAADKQVALFGRLLALGADVNAASNANETPLTLTVARAPAGIPLLLEHGANPNVITHTGQTPLLLTALAGDAEAVKQLLAHGADPNLKPLRSHTALYFAHRHKYAAIESMLQQAGGRAD